MVWEWVSVHRMGDLHMCEEMNKYSTCKTATITILSFQNDV